MQSQVLEKFGFFYHLKVRIKYINENKLDIVT
jgi:hypothetical protein